MKLKLLLTFFCIFVWRNSNAQDYIHTVEEGKIWKTKHLAGMGTTWYDAYQIRCDTPINNKQYYEVYWLNEDLLPESLIGYVREDTLEQQVFFLHKDSANEKLMANYKLEIGDTFRGNVVDSVYRKFIFGKDRKVVTFGKNHFINHAEGTGTYFGGIIYDGYNCAYCLVNGISMSTPKCEILPAIHELQPELFNIYPNPVNNIINVDYSLQKGQEFKYNLITLTGKSIKKGTVMSGSMIDVGDIGEQIFLLKLYNNKFTFSKLIVIARD